LFGEVFGLLYSPGECVLARLVDGKLRGPSGEVALDAVFEARLFSERAELRWISDGGGAGPAALLSDDLVPDDVRKALSVDASIKCDAEPISQTYLLWGTAAGGGRADWSALYEARIGTMHVPCAVAEGGRLCLKAVEYLMEDDHGNVSVAAERLTGFESSHG
jgi:CRISPR-associated protein (TIGR03984 family)